VIPSPECAAFPIKRTPEGADNGRDRPMLIAGDQGGTHEDP
jgi:hypothetical protein